MRRARMPAPRRGRPDMAARRISPLLFLPPVLFAGLALLFYLGLGGAGDTTLPSTREGHPAPAVQLVPLGDYPDFDDAALRAPGVKLVNFWASWCLPCRAEHPVLERIAKEHGVRIYGINYKDKPEEALKFLAELGNPYVAIGADAKGRTGIEWGIYGVPETFVIDGQGTILLRFAGPMTEQSFLERIKPVMDAAK